MTLLPAPLVVFDHRFQTANHLHDQMLTSLMLCGGIVAVTHVGTSSQFLGVKELAGTTTYEELNFIFVKCRSLQKLRSELNKSNRLQNFIF